MLLKSNNNHIKLLKKSLNSRKKKSFVKIVIKMRIFLILQPVDKLIQIKTHFYGFYDVASA